MGTYHNSNEEIKEILTSAIDDIEGDIDSFQLKSVFKEIHETYPHTTDRNVCQKCCKMYQLYKTEKSLTTGVYSFTCPHCGDKNGM